MQVRSSNLLVVAGVAISAAYFVSFFFWYYHNIVVCRLEHLLDSDRYHYHVRSVGNPVSHTFLTLSLCFDRRKMILIDDVQIGRHYLLNRWN